MAITEARSVFSAERTATLNLKTNRLMSSHHYVQCVMDLNEIQRLLRDGQYEVSFHAQQER